jgi:integrase
VHDAVRDQLIAEVGAERLDQLHQVVDQKTFNAILHWLSGAQRSSVDTKHRYTEDITAFARWAAAHYGMRPVPLLDVLDFDSVTVWTVWARSQGIAARSQNRVLACVSSLFGDAVPRGWAKSNPVSFRHHAPKVGSGANGRPAGATRVLPPEDTAKLLVTATAALDAADSPDAVLAAHQDLLVFGLLYTLGMRESEVIKLRAERIDRTVSPPVIEFERKRGKWVRRQVSPALLAHLDAVLGDRTEGPILLDPKTGRARNRHQIIDITRRLARHAKLTHPVSVTPHALRASAITDLLNAGVPAQEVQAWADHASPVTTMGYWERSAGLQRDAALSASLDAHLAAVAAGIGGT